MEKTKYNCKSLMIPIRLKKALGEVFSTIIFLLFLNFIVLPIFLIVLGSFLGSLHDASHTEIWIIILLTIISVLLGLVLHILKKILARIELSASKATLYSLSIRDRLQERRMR